MNRQDEITPVKPRERPTDATWSSRLVPKALKFLNRLAVFLVLGYVLLMFLLCIPDFIGAAHAYLTIRPGMTGEEVFRAAPAPSHNGRLCKVDGTEVPIEDFFNVVMIGSRAADIQVGDTGQDLARLVSGMRFCGRLRIAFFDCLTPGSSSFEVVFDEDGRVLDKTIPRPSL
jgi:hypothetical protein